MANAQIVAMILSQYNARLHQQKNYGWDISGLGDAIWEGLKETLPLVPEVGPLMAAGMKATEAGASLVRDANGDDKKKRDKAVSDIKDLADRAAAGDPEAKKALDIIKTIDKAAQSGQSLPGDDPDAKKSPKIVRDHRGEVQSIRLPEGKVIDAHGHWIRS